MEKSSSDLHNYSYMTLYIHKQGHYFNAEISFPKFVSEKFSIYSMQHISNSGNLKGPRQYGYTELESMQVVILGLLFQQRQQPLLLHSTQSTSPDPSPAQARAKTSPEHGPSGP